MSGATLAREVSVVRVLAWREIVRFLRQRHRVMGAVGQPLVFWVLFGAGLRNSFRLTAGEGGPSFLEYYFPGTLMLVLLFTAIFSTISVIEDRREGFLQGVLVAPVSRWAMVLGKVLGGTCIAMLHGLIFLLMGLIFQRGTGAWAWMQLGGLLFVSAVAMTGLGFVIAWRMQSTQGFHAVMNLLLMPMWLLSGAFFPVPDRVVGMPWSQWALHWVMRANPVTYCVAGVRRVWTGTDLPAGYYQPSLAAAWSVSLVFASFFVVAATRIARTRTTGDAL